MLQNITDENERLAYHSFGQRTVLINLYCICTGRGCFIPDKLRCVEFSQRRGCDQVTAAVIDHNIEIACIQGVISPL